MRATIPLQYPLSRHSMNSKAQICHETLVLNRFSSIQYWLWEVYKAPVIWLVNVPTGSQGKFHASGRSISTVPCNLGVLRVQLITVLMKHFLRQSCPGETLPEPNKDWPITGANWENCCRRRRHLLSLSVAFSGNYLCSHTVVSFFLTNELWCKYLVNKQIYVRASCKGCSFVVACAINMTTHGRNIVQCQM